ncbi:hypothetical protein K7711_36385 [Nocardia sp. CA2R105]|uniref:hypothetical protein n=1 Tax=Nocardia coffeae TaxID=2873381 RepID=UPI001CA60677|nr:hypothetical protein [Nocardia coffeae]MBY8862002.1 hypothetical protein [Nocardia coffeae]
MFRLSWAFALAFTIAALTGVLILTRDLSISNDIFKDGVSQAKTVDRTTDTALIAAGELGPADHAVTQSMPQVVGVIGSLTAADGTLDTLGTQLQSLADALKAADPPLVGIIQAGGAATVQANAAAQPAAQIVNTLSDANTKAQQLSGVLDNTLSLSRTIDSKLRVALILPKVPR